MKQIDYLNWDLVSNFFTFMCLILFCLEAQVRSIADHVRPDRQTLMFSATFQPKIEKLASYALSNPVKILCGDVGVANTDVLQMVRILPDLDSKFNWLFHHLVEFCTGKILDKFIFNL